MALRRQSRTLAAAAALVAVTIVSYWPAFQAGYLLDDDVYLTDNPTMESRDGLRDIWLDPSASPQYYPLMFTSLWLEHRLWGVHPAGYHVTNVLLHTVNAVLLWRVLSAIGVPGGYLAALVFALHPVHVESVAWIAERKDVLSTGFSLLTVLAWLRFMHAPRPRAFALIAVLFAAAILSKTVTVTLPATLLLLTWWRQPAFLRRAVGALFALGGAAAVLALITIWREGRGQIEFEMPPLAPLDRVLVAGRAVWFYLGKLAYPAPLMTIYPRWAIESTHLVSYLFPLAVVAGLALLWWQRARLGRGPFVAFAFFLLTLLPSLGLVDFHFLRLAFVADHFQYLASAGPIAVVSVALSVWLTRWQGAARTTLQVAIAAVLGAAALLTWQQARLYRTADTLWLHNLEHNPTAWLPHYNLANSMRDKGQLAAAVEHYRAAIQVAPQLAEAHLNLGVALTSLGFIDGGIEAYRASIRARPTKVNAHYNLANSLMQKREYDEAIEHLRIAIAQKPDYILAHNNLGVALEAVGRYAEAAEQYRLAVRIEPTYLTARQNLARLKAAGRIP